MPLEREEGGTSLPLMPECSRALGYIFPLQPHPSHCTNPALSSTRRWIHDTVVPIFALRPHPSHCTKFPSFQYPTLNSLYGGSDIRIATAPLPLNEILLFPVPNIEFMAWWL